MVEIEIGVMAGQCLDRRIADKATMVDEVAEWERARNAEGAAIKWLFTVERAREKLGRRYPRTVATFGALPFARVRTRVSTPGALPPAQLRARAA